MNLNSKSYIFQYFSNPTQTNKSKKLFLQNRDLIIYGKVLKVIEEFTIPCYVFSIIYIDMYIKKVSLKGKFLLESILAGKIPIILFVYSIEIYYKNGTGKF